MDIKIKKGLNIPIKGVPEGTVKNLLPSGQATEQNRPQELSLALREFDDLRMKLLKKVGEKVEIGQAICEDKACPGRVFVSPAAGTIRDVRRGLKRRIIDIIIEPDQEEKYVKYPPLNPESAERDAIIKRLLTGGMFAKIRQRPFSILANPQKIPRSIFVKAVESAPFAVPPELQVAGYEAEFQSGLNALSRLTEKAVHLVYHKESECRAFTKAKNVTTHSIEGPHPIGNYSVHIQHIDPIDTPEDVVWTLSVHDVISIGMLLTKGRYHNEKVISIAGPGVIDGQRGYFRLREGYPIAGLVAGRIPKSPSRLISGDPLTGFHVDMEDFMGLSHSIFCVIPEYVKREILHFFRLGLNKYSFSRAYASGHVDVKKKKFNFTTSLHGEHRAFIEPSLYDKVMPLNIPTMQLVKAVMAEDFDLAEELGILEVAPEDFALPTFVCPSKMEMTEIMKQGIRTYAEDILG